MVAYPAADICCGMVDDKKGLSKVVPNVNNSSSTCINEYLVDRSLQFVLTRIWKSGRPSNVLKFSSMYVVRRHDIMTLYHTLAQPRYH